MLRSVCPNKFNIYRRAFGGNSISSRNLTNRTKHFPKSLIQDRNPNKSAMSSLASGGSSQKLLSSKVFDVSGLTAVVTGGGTGLGQMMAEALCSNGAKVYIVGRRKDPLEAVVKQYGNKGPGDIIALPGDVSSKDDSERLAREVETREPKGIQLLVNNAGVARDQATKYSEVGEPKDLSSADAIKSHFWKSTPESWDETFRTNVTGPYFTSLAFLPLLQQGHGGALGDGYTSSIVNVASISGYIKRNSGGQFSYACSKAAALHLTRTMGNTFVNTGVRVNCIAPGVFPSEMTGSAAGDDQKSKLSRTPGNPMRRAGKDEDMAACILYLAGPGGLFLNCQVLHPDGGVMLVSPAAI